MTSSMSFSRPLKSIKKTDALGLLGYGIYGLLTLLPDSGTLMLSWPWVVVWQIMLLLPWLWLVKHWWRSQSVIALGLGLDYGMGLAILALIGSSVFSPFPQQAIWYSWAALSAIAACYTIKTWCLDPKKRTRLLTAQAGLGGILVILSLCLWITQTFIPELQRLSLLRLNGLDLPYNFSTLELRNWAPFGHQNYVAGYLTLCLPLLIGEYFIAKQKIYRLGWLLCSGLGFFTLYTTSSRGGWLGLGVELSLSLSILFLHRKIPLKLKLIPSISIVLALGLALIANNRLRSLLFSNPLKSGGDPYRLITNSMGWFMGKDHPLLGAGPGSVPLLFQKYRPHWAGLEAEWHYQLHSTPAQIWAELGGWGILLYVVGIIWLTYWGIRLWRSPHLIGTERIRCGSIFCGLIGYSIVCLTDYQLNIVAISGTLIIYIVYLCSLIQETVLRTQPQAWESPRIKFLGLSTIGLLLATNLWLAPILRGWQLSNYGFEALQNNQIGLFTETLERSHQLVPWEPYYLYQLGINTGKAGLNIQDKQLKKQLLDQSQSYFEKSVQVSPYLEYGWTNLGWHLMKTEPSKAVQAFSQASELFPGRILAFHELGLSLLEARQPQIALNSFALEIIRNPLWMTSPVWRSQPLALFYPEVIKQVENFYLDLLETTKDPNLNTAVHRTLGGLYWWQGNNNLAEKHWTLSKTKLGLDLLKTQQGILTETQALILQAWLNPNERGRLIEKAFIFGQQVFPDPKKIDAIVRNMDQATSINQWLKEKPLVVYGVRTRTGFGINAGHIDGPAPQDLSGKTSNYAIATFFASLFEMPIYNPTLDQSLQPLRKEVWSAAKKL
jgi:uncharacterized protein involved in response to NO